MLLTRPPLFDAPVAFAISIVSISVGVLVRVAPIVTTPKSVSDWSSYSLIVTSGVSAAVAPAATVNLCPLSVYITTDPPVAVVPLSASVMSNFLVPSTTLSTTYVTAPTWKEPSILLSYTIGISSDVATFFIVISLSVVSIAVYFIV